MAPYHCLQKIVLFRTKYLTEINNGMIFPKPTQEQDYFKGIIRNSAALVSATSSYDFNQYNPNHVIKNDIDKYWCSAIDSTFNQYIDISIPSCHSAKVLREMKADGI